uniref:Uncharacterized protein n=1 Tax=Anguilla anguilla TaxID=7936 RepID=A0A0E9P9Z6_ANGAN
MIYLIGRHHFCPDASDPAVWQPFIKVSVWPMQLSLRMLHTAVL